MKGLFIKEWEYLKNQKRVFVILALIIGAQFVSGNTMFGMAFLIFMASSIIVNGISVDDTNNSYPFLLSLPIDRKTYVAEKYLATVLASALGWIVAVAVALTARVKPQEMSAGEGLTYCAAIIVVAFLFHALWLPIQIKYDAAKAQTMRFISVAAVLIIAFGGVYLLKKAGVDVAGVLESVSQMTALQALAAGAAVAVVLFFISYKASVRIMEKKEF